MRYYARNSGFVTAIVMKYGLFRVPKGDILLIPLKIEWIEEAKEPEKTFRRMIVAWQNSRYLLQRTVMAFTEEYVKDNEPNDMEKIALKRMVIACLHEIKPQIYRWYNTLDSMGALSDESKKMRADKVFRKILLQTEKFKKLRNLAFHYGDPTEDTDSLVDLYKQIDSMTLAHLNLILRNTVDLGESLWRDACKQVGLPC